MSSSQRTSDDEGSGNSNRKSPNPQQSPLNGNNINDDLFSPQYGYINDDNEHDRSNRSDAQSVASWITSKKAKVNEAVETGIQGWPEQFNFSGTTGMKQNCRTVDALNLCSPKEMILRKDNLNCSKSLRNNNGDISSSAFNGKAFSIICCDVKIVEVIIIIIIIVIVIITNTYFTC